MQVQASEIHPVVVIGAGPVGIFQLFELGLQGFTKVPIIDTLDRPGGQCAELYPTKPIYDIPGLPEITGDQLTQNLLEQCKNFEPQFYLGHQVISVERVKLPDRDDTVFRVETQATVPGHLSETFLTKTVVIAGGNGSFTPNQLKAPGVDRLANVTIQDAPALSYSVKNPALYHGKEVLILGGGDSALDWALELQPHAAVTLISRTSVYKAAKSSVAKFQALADDGEAIMSVGQIEKVELHPTKPRIGVQVRGGDGVLRTLETDNILCFYGLNPKLGPIAEWGIELFGKKIKQTNLETFETNVEGIFAIGDIITYPGRKALILTGFHEAAMVSYGVYKRVHGHDAVFAFTTTSPMAHARLGVNPDLSDL